jgi:hypothetical protein
VTEQSEMLPAALAYAARGMPVFPCKPDKRPFTANGFKDASTAPQTIRTMWTAHHGAMIGLPTGKASELVVVDVDVDPAKGLDGLTTWAALVSQHGAPVTTRTHRTPRGGLHLVFRHPGEKVKSTTSALAAGIDTRGDGGYVILPPSRNGSAPYTVEVDTDPAPLPAWLIALFRERGIMEAPAAPKRSTPTFNDAPPSREKIEDALRHVSADCSFNDWLSIGMALHNWNAEAGRALWDTWSASAPERYDDAAISQHWRTFADKPGGVTIATLFKRARENGWKPAAAFYGAAHATAAKPATVPSVTVDAIRATLWTISQEPKLTPTERNRAIASAVVEWLHARGRFYFHADRRDFGGVLYFDAARKLLLPVQGDAFLAWLADAIAMNRAERPFVFVQSACETEGLSERATGIDPATYWAATTEAYYMSNGPGHMARVTAEGVALVDNGTDNILFPYGATLAPWKLTEPADPFQTCAIFRDMSTAAPHGKELLRLWLVALPADLSCKPPVCISSLIGGGKTALVRGMFKLLGISEQINAVTKTGDGDFWATLDGGGLVCFDNVDTKIDWLPDALAAGATAGTHQKRKLYTDADRVTLRARAWVALTSASPSFAADAGLADRLLVVRLNRRTGETAESALFEEVARNRDGGLSWIAQVLSRALADKGDVPTGLNARHPDFARLAVRIGRAMGRGDEAVAALRAAESDKSLFNLENDWIGATLLELLQAGPFTGSAGVLLEALKMIDPSLDGKVSVKRLGKRLAKLWPHLESAFHARQEKDGHTREIRYSLGAPEGFAQFAQFETALSEKSLCERNNRTLCKTPFETTQTTQDDFDWTAEAEDLEGGDR